MNKNIISLLAVAALVLAFYSCTKSSSYTNTDYTAGMAGNARHWVGTAYGYDTAKIIVPPSTVLQSGAVAFTRTISDTTFSIEKVNGYLIKVLGFPMAFRSTNTTINTVDFDSTKVGSPKSWLTYFHNADSISFEIHNVGAFNSVTNNYIEHNYIFHTK